MLADITERIVNAHEFTPSGTEKLGVEVVLKPVVSKRIAVIYFNKQCASIGCKSKINLLLKFS